MKEKYFVLVTMLLFLVPCKVCATNDVDYQLTITDDFKFKEIIRYEISDYSEKENGYNPFADIVANDVGVDILGKADYKKTKTYNNGKYYVTLSYTHSEYSLTNSILLNDCFENSNYDYDMDSYSFSGSGGFYCLKGDSLKITIITNLEVVSTNAVVSGNKYVWTPVDNNFTMNIKMNKEYTRQDSSDGLGHGINEDVNETDNGNTSADIPDGVDNYDEDPQTDYDNNNTNHISLFVISGIIICLLVAGIVIFLVLKKKKDGLNKI